MTLRRPLKVAVLGCEHCHIRGFARLVEKRTDLDVIQVWGREYDRASYYADTFGADRLLSPDGLSEVDLAVVLSDTRDHRWLVEAAAGKVGAVHVDKPLGLNAEDASAVAALAEPFEDRFAVGFFARHNTLVRELVRRIKADEIGALQHLSITFGHAGMQEGWLLDWPALLDRARMGYGAFGDLGSHMIDLAEIIAGRLTPISCALDYREGFLGDVGGLAAARSDSGCLARFYVSTIMQGPRFEIRADGEKGTLWFRGKSLGIYGESDEPEILMRGEWSEASDSTAALANKLLGLPHFPPASARDGLRVNQLLDQFEELAKNNWQAGREHGEK